MAFMDWEEKYSVKNTLLDTQHKKLVGFINQLHDAMKRGKGKDEVGSILNSLASYTKSHFATEENYLKSIHYSELATHKVIHQNLIKQVEQLISEVDNNKLLVVTDTMNFLKNWLADHIMKEDMKYSKVAQPA